MLFNRFRRGELRLGRVEAFSDGVFAIVVTLLVLELKVPLLGDPRSKGALLEGLRELLPKFVGWLLSFVIVCKFWLNHNRLLDDARRADYALVWLNSLFLLGQAFIPFPTALLGEYPSNPLAVAVFGCVMAGNTLLFIALQAYIAKHLLKPELVDSRDRRTIVRAFVGPLSYLAGAVAGWFYTPAGFAFYAVTPLFYLVPPETRR
jgi:uncharacterized membrane protein